MVQNQALRPFNRATLTMMLTISKSGTNGKARVLPSDLWHPSQILDLGESQAKVLLTQGIDFEEQVYEVPVPCW